VGVGKISGFLELWTIDPDTRLASRIMTRMVSNPFKKCELSKLTHAESPRYERKYRKRY